jgi:hypothetical protein
LTIKAFTTAAKADGDEFGEPITFPVDGHDTTFNPPTSGQISVALIGASDMATSVEAAAATINFFFSLLDDEDVTHYKRRLFDREDPFGPETIGELIEMLMEEWSARPTKQPTDYAPSQRSGGQRSTPTRHRAAASTRSR